MMQKPALTYIIKHATLLRNIEFPQRDRRRTGAKIPTDIKTGQAKDTA